MNEDHILSGIHHISAIASDPQQNVDFYAGLLGLRLVKRTVNFDDPSSYHLYYGDGLGNPGTIMTFFSWPGALSGRVGGGQVGVTAFSIPSTSMQYWSERLTTARVSAELLPDRFGDLVLTFSDPDGLQLELIAPAIPDNREAWSDGPVPPEHAIRGFHAPTLYSTNIDRSTQLLTETMGFHETAKDGDRVRYSTGAGTPGATVDLRLSALPFSRSGAGTVHHIAWRTPNDAAQIAWQDTLASAGVGVTEVRDRQYFHSIYYREPGAILYEIATDPPGFAIDEAPNALGTILKLPPWLEAQRAAIEHSLPAIALPHDAMAGSAR